MNPLEPFIPAMSLVAGIGVVLTGYFTFKKVQKADVKVLIHEDWDARQEALEKAMRAVIAEAFTGKAEADAHFRAEVSSNYRTMLREALDDHSMDERSYIDSLRDKIVEYHVESKTAITDAKQIAIRVANDYQHLLTRLRMVEVDLDKIRAELAAMATSRTA